MRFRLVLLEAESGIVLNQAGRWHLRGQPRFEPTFECKADAVAMKDDLVRLFPWAEVIIRDETKLANGDRTGEGARSTYRASREMRARFDALRASYLRYHAAFPLVRMFMARPADPWDPTSYV